MSICNMKGITIRFRQTPDQKRRPECGDKMIELDQSNENGAFFVWHQCSRNNCDGQSLQKVSQKSQNSSLSDISQ
jgi:hypothetical protein